MEERTGFLQSIKAALCIKLKEEMDCNKMMEREEEQVSKILNAFREIPGMNILADNVDERIGAYFVLLRWNSF